MKTIKNKIDFNSLYNTLFLRKNKIDKNTLGLKSDEGWAIPLYIYLMIIAGAVVSGIALFMSLLGIVDIDGDEMVGYFILFYFGSYLYKYLVGTWMVISDSRDKKTIKVKNGVVAPLIKGINPSFKYNGMNYIPRNIFVDSKIFNQRIGSYKGNDLTMGKIDDNYIMFSDLLVKNFMSTIFHGQFIVTEFNKNFEGITLVSTDYAQAIFGSVIGGLFQSSVGDMHLIKMDNPEFEEAFVVHASDKVEARYILTPSFMEYILSYQKKTERFIQISFINNTVCIAIPYNKDQFEDNFPIGKLGKELQKAFDNEFVKPLELATGVIRELKLNQKLWE